MNNYDYPADDSDETWHMHDDETWGWGVSCGTCYTGRGFPLQRGPLVGTVKGGHNDEYGSARYKFQRDFEPGMVAYEKARGEGLQPKSTTLAGVAEAQATVKSQEAAVKKLGGELPEGTRVAAGVAV